LKQKGYKKAEIEAKQTVKVKVRGGIEEKTVTC
jgi:hypothetical protein